MNFYKLGQQHVLLLYKINLIVVRHIAPIKVNCKIIIKLSKVVQLLIVMGREDNL